mgnify:CR=1 FL=1
MPKSELFDLAAIKKGETEKAFRFMLIRLTHTNAESH